MIYYEVYVYKHKNFIYCFEDILENGTFVIVNLKNKKKLGIIISKLKKENYNFKVLKILNHSQGISENYIEYIKKVSDYYMLETYKFLKSIFNKILLKIRINSFIKKDKINELFELIRFQKEKKNNSKAKIVDKINIYESINEIKKMKKKNILIIVPNIFIKKLIKKEFTQIIDINDDFYNAYKNGGIVIGMRSSIIMPISNLENIFIIDGNSYLYKSNRSPRYDAVYISLIRSFFTNVIIFTPLINIEQIYFLNKNFLNYKSYKNISNYNIALNFKKDSHESSVFTGKNIDCLNEKIDIEMCKFYAKKFVCINLDNLLKSFNFKNTEKIFSFIFDILIHKPNTNIILNCKNFKLKIIKFLINLNYFEFVEKEMKIRKDLKYPPFYETLHIYLNKNNKNIENIKENISKIIEYDFINSEKKSVIVCRYKNNKIKKNILKVLNKFKDIKFVTDINREQIL